MHRPITPAPTLGWGRGGGSRAAGWPRAGGTRREPETLARAGAPRPRPRPRRAAAAAAERASVVAHHDDVRLDGIGAARRGIRAPGRGARGRRGAAARPAGAQRRGALLRSVRATSYTADRPRALHGGAGRARSAGNRWSRWARPGAGAGRTVSTLRLVAPRGPQKRRRAAAAPRACRSARGTQRDGPQPGLPASGQLGGGRRDASCATGEPEPSRVRCGAARWVLSAPCVPVQRTAPLHGQGPLGGARRSAGGRAPPGAGRAACAAGEGAGRRGPAPPCRAPAWAPRPCPGRTPRLPPPRSGRGGGGAPTPGRAAAAASPPPRTRPPAGRARARGAAPPAPTVARALLPRPPPPPPQPPAAAPPPPHTQRRFRHVLQPATTPFSKPPTPKAGSSGPAREPASGLGAPYKVCRGPGRNRGPA
jgi:hypothetical protein